MRKLEYTFPVSRVEQLVKLLDDIRERAAP